MTGLKKPESLSKAQRRKLRSAQSSISYLAIFSQSVFVSPLTLGSLGALLPRSLLFGKTLSIVIFIFNYNACHFVMVFYYLHWIFSYICRGLFFRPPCCCCFALYCCRVLRPPLAFITCQTFFIFSALLAFIYKASDWLAHTLVHTQCYLFASGWKNFLAHSSCRSLRRNIVTTKLSWKMVKK